MKKGLIIVLVIALCLSLTGCKSSDYKKALEYQELGEYELAITVYETLGDYKDSATQLDECRKIIAYNEALKLLEAKDYYEAFAKFEELGSYAESELKKTICEEMISAMEGFEAACKGLSIKNEELEAAIAETKQIVESENKAFDETLRALAANAISEAEAAKIEIPDMPEDQAAIITKTEEMANVDYTDVLNNLKEHTDNLEKSMKQYACVNNPSEEYVVNCLITVPGVMEVCAATEDNDPNGKLGKAGGYTAAIYFSHEYVNQNSVYGTTVIDKGTSCGGQVEVYATEEDAIKRNEYLANFDGSIWSSGSHTVIGTCVIRTSDELKASQQKELEANIIAALINID